jgi:hypothetical protein
MPSNRLSFELRFTWERALHMLCDRLGFRETYESPSLGEAGGKECHRISVGLFPPRRTQKRSGPVRLLSRKR